MTRLIPAIVAALVLTGTATTPALAQFEPQSVQNFRVADGDGDERLTRTEFRTFIQLMAREGAPVSVRIRNLGAYRIAFGRVDLNNDGLATPAELRAAERAN